jgi:hypothetical protein
MDRQTYSDEVVRHGRATNDALDSRHVEAPRGSARWPVLILVCLCLFPVLLHAQAKDESAVKAAFVFNLTKYVEWPASASSQEIVIGFIGDGAMGPVLKQVLSGKAAGSRTVRVVVEPSKDELLHCNIVYVSYSAPPKIRALLDRIANRNVLTVGDSASFTQSGGAVGLVTARDHVQIQINPAAVEAAQLKISSRLLSLATLVNQAPAR